MNGINSLRDLQYLFQADVREEFIRNIGKAQWQIVYEYRRDPQHNWGIFSSLLEERHLSEALARDSYDLMVGAGLPGFGQHSHEGETVTTYLRYGNFNDIRPFRH